ncbi:MAG TPA: ATP-binding protein, partial [Thermodesulfobacteriota bacterium]|nr:ATP-binding protein [Thermodesulfobacteriota bacterium]
RQAKPSLQWIDINDALNMSLLLLEKQGGAEGIDLQADLAAELPLVRADLFQLQQVFTNILLNASQALAAGGDPPREKRISVRTRFHESGDARPQGWAGPTIQVAVEDTGPGISPDHLDKIFDPFFTTKNTGEGAGLGLYIVSGILKNYGAHIRVESQLGRGTTFFIDFPLAEHGKY